MTLDNVGYFLVGAAIMTAVSHYHGKNPYLAIFSAAIWALIGFFMYTQSTYPATGIFDVQYGAFLAFVFFGIMELFETTQITRKVLRDRKGRVISSQDETESDETVHDRDTEDNVNQRISDKEKELYDKYGRPVNKSGKLLG